MLLNNRGSYEPHNGYRLPRSFQILLKGVVRGGGLEPPQYCYRQDLNLVRLPISPPAQKNSATRRALRNTLKVLAGPADRWKSVSRAF